jgi:hypothetical protein
LINKGFLNTNTVITQQLMWTAMEASSAGKREYGGKGRWVKYWAHLGCWISPFYGPFLFGACFETYKPFISLILQFFLGRSKQRITENAATESADTGVRLYIKIKTVYSVCLNAACDHSHYITCVMLSLQYSNPLDIMNK